MKKTLSAILVLWLFSLSGFVKESANYEQITFDYFVTDILRSDFKEVTSFEFKGKTEESYSTLGTYKFCLKPERLGLAIEDVTKGSGEVKEIKSAPVKGLTIVDFQSKGSGAKLFVYPSVHVADNYYVLLSFQKSKEQAVEYIFELTPEGKISRSCRAD